MANIQHIYWMDCGGLLSRSVWLKSKAWNIYKQKFFFHLWCHLLISSCIILTLKKCSLQKLTASSQFFLKLFRLTGSCYMIVMLTTYCRVLYNWERFIDMRVVYPTSFFPPKKRGNRGRRGASLCLSFLWEILNSVGHHCICTPQKNVLSLSAVQLSKVKCLLSFQRTLEKNWTIEWFN